MRSNQIELSWPGSPALLFGTNRLTYRPYVIATYHPGRHLIRLVRNRSFRQWSVDAQPDGYPDALVWSWRLAEATPEQRQHWRLIGDGTGIHWPDVDEDISARGMLEGGPARRPRGR